MSTSEQTPPGSPQPPRDSSPIRPPMHIVIRAIPHSEQAYPTVGNYWRDTDGVLQIRISQMSDFRSELAVAIHELIEQALTEAAGITNEAIDAFDIGHPELDDPGDDPRSPYHREHVIATMFEKLACSEMGLPWDVHCTIVDAAE